MGIEKTEAGKEADADRNGLPTDRKKIADLEMLVKECEEAKGSWGLVQNDIVFAVVFWAMIECGFESLGNKSVDDKNQFTLPENWKHKTRQVYEAHFVLPPYVDNLVKMVALPTEDILCVNVFVSNLSPKNINLKSLAIHSSGYVPRPEEATFMYKFSGLHEFQVLLRNTITWPIRCSILTHQGIMNGSLGGLSDEIKLKIFHHLSFKEILLLSQTCHDLHRICSDQGLWKTLFHKNFKDICKCSKKSEECEESPNWKETYKQAYVQNRASSVSSAQNSPEGSFHTVLDAPFGSEIDISIY